MESKIILAKGINVDTEYKNVLSYSESDMVLLVQSKATYSADNYSFINQSKNKMLVGTSYETAMLSNYMAFQNTQYYNKWFFAWIEDVEYRSESSTVITFKIDSWSTFFNKVNVNPCFVVREHVNDDTIGLHTIPENLDCGEYITEKYSRLTDNGNIDFLNGGVYYILAATKDLWDASIPNVKSIHNYGGFITPYIWYAFEDVTKLSYAISTLTDELSDYLTSLQKGIADIFIVPRTLIPNTSIVKIATEYEFGENSGKVIDFQNNVNLTYDIDKSLSYNDFIPKNNKCYCYPYNFLQLTNAQGQYVNLKYECFNTEKMRIKVYGVPSSSGCSILASPVDYLNVALNLENSILCGRFPSVQWSSDGSKEWLAKNGASSVASLTGGIIGAVSSIVTSNPVGVVASAGLIASNISNINQGLQAPTNINGTEFSGDVMYVINNNRFHLYFKRAKKEYLDVVDSFFTRCGYKINKIKAPNIRGRQYFNHVQIAQSEEIGGGDVPNKYMDEINRACRNGVTIWHNNENVGNYSLNNTII